MIAYIQEWWSDPERVQHDLIVMLNVMLPIFTLLIGIEIGNVQRKKR